MAKYRIIEVRDGNDNPAYQVEVNQGWRWLRYETLFSRYSKHENLRRALQYVDQLRQEEKDRTNPKVVMELD